MTRPVTQPQFAEPQATPDPTKFLVRHASDTAAYKELDTTPHLPPLPFQEPRGLPEPVMRLEDALGESGAATVNRIKTNRQIVFHSVGDTGNTRSVKPQTLVADKMVSDFDELAAKDVPAFFYHLGDVVYSFGEANYYYDQFYEPYRDYPAPIFAIPGNHDGMVSPLTPGASSLTAFYDNFCSPLNPAPRISKDAGGLPRTAMQQPGVFFTLEAPFVRIIGLYSNRLENPGVIAHPAIGNSQLDFLDAALERAASDWKDSALIIAVHHPAYSSGGKHPGSPDMRKQIDAACEKHKIWPHAVLSGHAHNYQRFTRIRNAGTKDETHIPYVTCGNGGHNVTRLTHATSPPLRTPLRETSQEQDNSEQVVLESYDDQDYGYLRIIADATQLRIEYHPQSDGTTSKTPDDAITVDLASRRLVHYRAATETTTSVPQTSSKGHAVHRRKA